MINIRKNIFETNSSSTHSICISNNKPEKFPDKLVFSIGEFGWKEEVLNSVEELASYLYTAISHYYFNDEKKKSEYLNYIYDSLGSIGCNCEFEPVKKSKYGLEEGYIDHIGELKDFLEAIRHSKNRLFKYLFSEKSFIVTGNDNSDWFDEYMNELDLSNFEEYKKNEV